MPRPTEAELATLEERIGYRFGDVELLVQALTHGSAKSESNPSNERMEFLGDAILGMVVSTLLFANHPDLNEGRLTKIKAQAVSRHSLLEVAEDIGLAEFMVVGKMFSNPEDISGSIIANAVEAIIAAIYLDGGFDDAIDYVVRFFKRSLVEAAESPGGSDSKSLLGQWAQRSLGVNPTYVVEAVTGPDHQLTFDVTVSVRNRKLGSATGSSKKEAEQRAARIALGAIEDG